MKFKAALFLLMFAGISTGAEIRGSLVFGHEVRELRPCGDDIAFWLILSPELREKLEVDLQRLAVQPYEPVYAQLQGAYVEAPADGFGAGYDGAIDVREVLSLADENIDSCRSGTVTDGSLDARATRPPAARDTETYLFVCEDGSTYTVRTTGESAWIFLLEGTLELPGVKVESGESYSDGHFELRIEEGRARLGPAGGELDSCFNDRRRAVWERAKLDGADFRAVGNEPCWHFEILRGEEIVLVTDYGAARIELPLPQPVVNREERSTRWDAGEIVVEVLGRQCLDTMSGEAFESKVRVVWGSRVLEGCGRALH